MSVVESKHFQENLKKLSTLTLFLLLLLLFTFLQVLIRQLPLIDKHHLKNYPITICFIKISLIDLQVKQGKTLPNNKV